MLSTCSFYTLADITQRASSAEQRGSESDANCPFDGRDQLLAKYRLSQIGDRTGLDVPIDSFRLVRGGVREDGKSGALANQVLKYLEPRMSGMCESSKRQSGLIHDAACIAAISSPPEAYTVARMPTARQKRRSPTRTAVSSSTMPMSQLLGSNAALLVTRR